MQGYYTVTEYAKLTGKDPGNIRRLLIYGTILGEKFGRQWMIPEDTIYPADQRVKSGEFRNWRKTTKYNQKYKDLMQTLHSMSEKLGDIYGGCLSQVILYGSYARKEETPESDVDIALLLTDDSEAAHDRATDIIVDYELELGKTISVIPIQKAEMDAWKSTSPFYRNIEKEGVILWKSA